MVFIGICLVGTSNPYPILFVLLRVYKCFMDLKLQFYDSFNCAYCSKMKTEYNDNAFAVLYRTLSIIAKFLPEFEFVDLSFPPKNNI